ncbi:YjfI family protein [Pseudoalteromonas phenolica]|uniref:YjfI family protein n=1 Tax=Pseudoalteromonas phenolica TaxID=161398 RepID=UPI00110BDDD4|nr:DUF2170 family protein [Pseudoalteromonas phenolica]TMO57939.1 DUF2170 domain-containing protein [Pseudoalteromonas phenolica]
MDLNELALQLSKQEADGASFESFFINRTGQDVLQVIVDGNDELPIFVTQTDEQVLCICYLFEEQEVKTELRAELNDTLLRLNVPMPLSAFAKIDNKVAIFGALSTNSTFEQLSHEIVTLSGNAIDALEAISEYFVE